MRLPSNFNWPRNGFRYLLLMLLISISFTVTANPQLLRDIATTPIAQSSNPQGMVEVDGVLYFLAQDKDFTVGLWAIDTDGTTKKLIKEFFSISNVIQPIGDTLYFIADNYLWRYNTTNADLLKIDPGFRFTDESRFRSVLILTRFLVVDSTLYFTASHSGKKTIWKYDGINISPISDFNTYSGRNNLMVMGSSLYFVRRVGSSGDELWQYDGTNISLVADIHPGDRGSDPAGLTVVNNMLYFSADDGSSGRELWKYDGTDVSLVADINPGYRSSTPGELTVVNSTLYFSADDGISDRELWKYDGASVSLVADINSGSDSSLPANLTAVGNALYFRANDGSSGTELWKYDGTDVSLVADINSGNGSSTPSEFTVVDSTLYFSADDGSSGRELWEYDGTNAHRVTDLNPGNNGSSPDQLTVVGSVLYFSADDGSSGKELWKYDGSNAVQVANIKAETPGNSSPDDFIEFNNITYFSAGELWATDGITAWLAADIKLSNEYNDEYLTVFGNNLYFSADDDSGIGYELWKFDGTSASPVTDINKGDYGTSGNSFPRSLKVVDDSLFFIAKAGEVIYDYNGVRGNDITTGGIGIWKYDGANISEVEALFYDDGRNAMYIFQDYYPFPSYRDILVDKPIVVNGFRYFIHNNELWKEDGAGTSRVDTSSVDGYIHFYDLTVFNNTLYLSASVSNFETELWRYDGTNISLVADIHPGDGGSYPAELTVVNNVLYFRADDGISGTELWKFDGASVSQVADINPGDRGSYPSELTVVGNTLYFGAYDSTTGGELWKYTGTSVSQVADINPGSGGSEPRDLTHIGNKLYFSADDGVTGREPWVYSLEPTDNPTPSPALTVTTQVNGQGAAKPGPTLSAGSNLTWTYTVNNTGNTPLHDVTIRVRQKSPVFGSWQTPCALGTLDPGEPASCGIQDLAINGPYIALVVVRGTTSTGKVIETLSRVFYRGNSAVVIDPRLDNKRNIALGVLEAKDFDQATHATLLAEINASTSVSELHAIIVHMRTTNPGSDPRLDAKRNIALGVLEAKGFDQTTHDVLLAEINAATRISELHAIIVRMRSDNVSITPQHALSLAVTANGSAIEKPGALIPTGSTVNWTYTVTNESNAPLHNIIITQRQKLPSLGEWGTPCSFTILAPGATESCTSTTTAITDNYKALIVARSTLDNGDNIEDKVDAFYRH
ncbi:MAG: hypothetical protein V3W04_04825 [Gammaproteobacteria bacterium]